MSYYQADEVLRDNDPPELPEEIYKDQVDWYEHLYPELYVTDEAEALDLLESELEEQE